MTTCPSNVNYMHIIDHGRNYIEKNYQRPFLDRILRDALSKILPNSKLLICNVREHDKFMAYVISLVYFLIINVLVGQKL